MATKTTATATAEHPHESAMDYAEHERTFDGFMALLKWSTISIVALTVILYFLIQP
ncbi:aa3-type cytochrome c oxidase subunit IV [Devosia nitrariae]|uniref:Cytochrome c oxidase subunit IV bacterial aa3 type domain-containing protein n=1 Tax=Devosia nitrariae TaxID=2071872 RepID=A0ABQ5W9Y6_9HYPH|nr:aa3-type cytochrome c oxidase subunit IV [Devosia nitrariae]GLQ56863.1 hypothetical protein GCM10010862_41220 [Devosia nitrariae]